VRIAHPLCATLPAMWSDGLVEWFAEHGRHHLPWRTTTGAWEVLVSEVMLQQTSVARVRPRWHRFLRIWPDPLACASASLADVLREWQGLGYPRRARWLWLTAARVAERGWPADEAGLRTLPGVGRYTARALLAFSDVGGATPGSVATGLPPRDVNAGRVAARAALGLEPHAASPSALDAVLAEGRPGAMTLREYTYALFDVGALHCHAVPDCQGCPLAAHCRFRQAGTPLAPRRPRARYPGSLRQLRGAILAAALGGAERDPSSLFEAVSALPGATPERFTRALSGLVADQLLESEAGVGSAAGGSVPRR
jgi:A/G-specific adenine glycosylase